MAGETSTLNRSKNSSKVRRLALPLRRELAELDAHTAARRLLGCELVRAIGEQRLIGRIVETESYEETDAAAHSFGGPRGRNLVMFGPAGVSYVYFTYGLHYCLNVVAGQEGRGEAVLIRALEPLTGIDIMQQNRRIQGSTLETSKMLHSLCNGPAKLTQALGVGGLDLNGHDLTQPPLQLILRPPLAEARLTTTTRIGIRVSTEHLQRFYITDNPWVSKP